MQICNTQHHNGVVSGDIGYGMDLESNHFLMIWLSHHNVIHKTEEHIADQFRVALHPDCVMLVILEEKLSSIHPSIHLSSIYLSSNTSKW